MQQDYDNSVHHTKALVMTDGSENPLLIYVGSHNMSAGAWGTENHKNVNS